MVAPLKAYWWDGEPNYGDALNPHIISYVSGRQVRRSWIIKAELFAIGSIMRAVRKNAHHDGPKCHVWGTGMIDPMARDFVDKVHIGSVRGPLTATILRQDGVPHGDAGLLTAEALGISGDRPKRYKYGVVPHWTHTDNGEVNALLEALPNATMIDTRSNDVHAATEALAECEIILSSSLHGLICADSLGVPNLWMDSGNLGNTSRFKFFDYALSVGRPMTRPLEIKDILHGHIPECDVGYFANLPKMKETVKAAFPDQLRA